MNVLDRLGVAIANAGYTWTPEMRQAYEEGIKELEAEALAEQAEQEPVGVFANVNALTPEKGARWEQMIDSAYDGVEYIHLYAAPVRTKDLTDDEIATVYEQDEHHHGEFNYRFDPVSFARAVIAADREKNK